MSARGTVFRLRGPVRGCSFGVVASTRRVADARVGAFEESHIIAAFIDAVAGATVYMIRSSSSAFAPNTPTPTRRASSSAATKKRHTPADAAHLRRYERRTRPRLHNHRAGSEENPQSRHYEQAMGPFNLLL